MPLVVFPLASSVSQAGSALDGTYILAANFGDGKTATAGGDAGLGADGGNGGDSGQDGRDGGDG